MKNISGGNNLGEYGGASPITEEAPKPKPKRTMRVKKSYDDERAKWAADMTKFIAQVEKSYEQTPKKETYDFIASLESAYNCIK